MYGSCAGARAGEFGGVRDLANGGGGGGVSSVPLFSISSAALFQRVSGVPLPVIFCRSFWSVVHFCFVFWPLVFCL